MNSGTSPKHVEPAAATPTPTPTATPAPQPTASSDTAAPTATPVVEATSSTFFSGVTLPFVPSNSSDNGNVAAPSIAEQIRAAQVTTPTGQITDTVAADTYEVYYLYSTGFTPDDELVDVTELVEVRNPSGDEVYRCFPQDYSEGDDFNRGCAELQEAGFPWGDPRAGYNYDYNAACRDVSRHCNVPVDTWKWLVVTGEEIYLPGIGSIRDADGGAAMAGIINPWEIPGEFESAYILHGWWGTGEVWDMSDLTTTWDEATETYVDNHYGTYSLETLATLRDHYLYMLTDPTNPQFRGQCSQGTQCETVTYVLAIRWFDGTYHMVQTGQYVR